VALLGLLLALGLLRPAVAAATASQATPAAVATARLGEASLCGGHLPPAVDTLALARVTFAPGATATVAHGAHLFVVASGALTVETLLRAYVSPHGTPGPVHVDVPAGPPAAYAAGKRFVVAADAAPQTAIVNGARQPAVALVVSVADTAGAGIGASLTGFADVELLAVAAATVGAPLDPPGWSNTTAIGVSLTRVEYDPGGRHDVLGPAGRLLAVDAGAVNARVDGAAWHAPADAPARVLPPTARVSLAPGDALLVPGPDPIATRNVARGPSALLVVTVGQIYTVVPITC
jgi:hypothetical protein